jgi:flagellar biosynthesis GTPase FlhF
MKSIVRETDDFDEQDLLSAGREARLARIEEMLSDLHNWMRSEQVNSLPGVYRRLYSHLVSNDFERRYAASITRAIYQTNGASEPTEASLRATAAREISSGLETINEGMPTIEPRRHGERPYVIALVGSSGAGKTTMMYKLAVRAVLNFGLRVKIISCDTYKIGSVEGVQTIADILSIPFGIAFESEEVRSLVEDAEADLVIVDTAGRSDRPARDELSTFLAAARPDETHLVLSATMGQRALQETAALFLGEKISCVSFTKLDEGPSLGSMISAAHWMDLPLGYLSTGTVIPDDIVPATDVPVGEWTVEGLPVSAPKKEATHV